MVTKRRTPAEAAAPASPLSGKRNGSSADAGKSKGAGKTLGAGSGVSMVTPDAIATRAYDKWQARGCPFGDDLRDWFDAEQELIAPPPLAHGTRRSSSARRRAT